MSKAELKSISGFETTFITRAEMADEALEALLQRLKGVVTEYQGETVLNEDWGKQRMAYPIQKESRGRYTYLAYTGRGQVVQEIERTLRLQDHVLRFLSVNLSKDFSTEKFITDRAAAKEAAKRREQEREARREEKAAERRAAESSRSRDYGDDSDSDGE